MSLVPETQYIIRDDAEEPNAQAGPPMPDYKVRRQPEPRVKVPYLAIAAIAVVPMICALRMVWILLLRWEWWLDDNQQLLQIVFIALLIAPVFAILVALYYGVMWIRARVGHSNIIRMQHDLPIALRDVLGGYQDGPSRQLIEWSLQQHYGTQREWARHSSLRGLGAYSPTIHSPKGAQAEALAAAETLLLGDMGTMEFDRFWDIINTEAVHIKAIGPTTSGKSTMCQALLNERARRGDNILVITPVAAADDWAVKVVGALDHQDIVLAIAKLDGIADERRVRLNSMSRDSFNAMHNDIWVFVDETPDIASNQVTKKAWATFFTKYGSLARHLRIHLVVMAQYDTVAAFGTAGRSALKENLFTVRTAKVGDARTLEIEYGEDSTGEPMHWRVSNPERLLAMSREVPTDASDFLLFGQDELASVDDSPRLGGLEAMVYGVLNNSAPMQANELIARVKQARGGEMSTEHLYNILRTLISKGLVSKTGRPAVFEAIGD